jgi:hypothetical protein
LLETVLLETVLLETVLLETASLETVSRSFTLARLQWGQATVGGVAPVAIHLKDFIHRRTQRHAT